MRNALRAVLALAMLVTSVTARGGPAAPALVPKPAQVEFAGASFVLTPQCRVHVSPGSTEAEALGRYLAERLGAPAVLSTSPVSSPDGFVLLELDASAADLGEEGYTLAASPDGVRIRAPKAAGLFYGIQTLLQLLPAPGQGGAGRSPVRQSGPEKDAAWTVPGVTITDRPRFSWRGYLLDPARHFRSVDFLKRTIDLLACHKLNVLQLHLTDDQGWRLEIKKYPKLTEVGAWRGAGPQRHGGYYTQEEIREVVAYAASRFVTVVPEIEMPGHSVAALAAYPEYSCAGGPFEVWTRWGVSEDICCAGNDGTFAFRQGVLDEVLALFPSRFIHVGGDECPRTRWKACPKCRQRIQDENLKDETELHGYFIRRLDAYLTAKRRRLVGWDEILEGGLAPGAVVMSWRGEQGGIAAARMGHDVVMSPFSHCYLDQPLQAISVEKAYAYEPIPQELTPEQAKHVLGLQANMWGEQTPQDADVDRMTWPRLAALAEAGWSPREGRDGADFRARLEIHRGRLRGFGVR